MIKKRLNLIITGSSQAERALELYEILINFYEINVFITEGGKKFVKFPDEVKIYSDLFTFDTYSKGEETEHIAFSSNTVLNVVYPAAANFIGKLANGIIDDVALLTIALNGSDIKTLIYPGLHPKLEKNPFLKRNIDIITKTNSLISVSSTYFNVYPDGESGKGKIYDPNDVYDEIKSIIGQ